MSPFELLLSLYGGVLALAALAVVYRMIVGPTILDRAISSDSLVTLIVMGMALYIAQTKAPWAAPAMLCLTGLAFIGTVTFARFVAREDPAQGHRRRHPEEPSTDTGPLEAIHPDPGPGRVQYAWAEDGEGGFAEDGLGDAAQADPDGAMANGDATGSAGQEAHTADPAEEAESPDLEDPVEDPDHPGEPLPRPTIGSDSWDVEGEHGFGAQPVDRGFEADPWDPQDDAQDDAPDEAPDDAPDAASGGRTGPEPGVDERTEGDR